MKPKKSLGQNFLTDVAVVRRIVGSLDLTSDDLVIEIGPGRGALTERLLESGAQLTAVEIDEQLVTVLRTIHGSKPNFSIIRADILELDLNSLLAGTDPHRVKIVGNLPYYISTPIIQRLTDQRSSFSEAVLMLQREVVARLTAGPGESDRGFLTVLVENVFHATALFNVPPAAFFPSPKVWSTVMSLVPKEEPEADPSELRKLANVAFAQKRKTLGNNLKAAGRSDLSVLAAANIDPRRRAETLTIEEWRSLTDAIASTA